VLIVGEAVVRDQEEAQVLNSASNGSLQNSSG
jgi:hypothetical protein